MAWYTISQLLANLEDAMYILSSYAYTAQTAVSLINRWCAGNLGKDILGLCPNLNYIEGFILQDAVLLILVDINDAISLPISGPIILCSVKNYKLRQSSVAVNDFDFKVAWFPRKSSDWFSAITRISHYLAEYEG